MGLAFCSSFKKFPFSQSLGTSPDGCYCSKMMESGLRPHQPVPPGAWDVCHQRLVAVVFHAIPTIPLSQNSNSTDMGLAYSTCPPTRKKLQLKLVIKFNPEQHNIGIKTYCVEKLELRLGLPRNLSVLVSFQRKARLFDSLSARQPICCHFWEENAVFPSCF